MGGGQDLPHLLTVACGDNTSGYVIACPDLKFDYEASFTGLNFPFLRGSLSKALVCAAGRRDNHTADAAKHH